MMSRPTLSILRTFNASQAELRVIHLELLGSHAEFQKARIKTRSLVELFNAIAKNYCNRLWGSECMTCVKFPTHVHLATEALQYPLSLIMNWERAAIGSN